MVYSLEGISVVDLSVNVPGPVASARLRDLGAQVIKVEPPSGDPLAEVAPDWYSRLVRGKQVETLDLKRASGQRQLWARLDKADLLITSSRPTSIERLGLGWQKLHAASPKLSHIAIVGFEPPGAERAGHDLTYRAAVGLLEPPRLPQTLAVDLMGAERAASEALAALYHRRRGGKGQRRLVVLADAARLLAAPLEHGLTRRSGLLGGGYPRYGLYRSCDGWIALAALEHRLWERVIEALGEDDLRGADDKWLREELTDLFSRRSSSEWAELAEQHDLPLEVVRQPAVGSGEIS